MNYKPKKSFKKKKTCVRIPDGAQGSDPQDSQASAQRDTQTKIHYNEGTQDKNQQRERYTGMQNKTKQKQV